jgi:integrase
MARAIGKLSAVTVKTAGKGMYSDGAGLYLHVNAAGARSWIFRFMLNGKAREMGLGPVHTIPLAEARRRAAECRRQRLDGTDPIEARRAGKVQAQERARLDAAKAMSFEACAHAYISAHRDGWKSPKSLAAWQGTLETDVFPVFGKVPVAAIDTGLVTKALQPIWTKKPETASRVRGRIEAILGYAVVHGWRPAGVNPATWRGHLDKVLPKKAKVRQLEHHAALTFPAIPAFMEELRRESSTAASALEFTILNAARTGEVIGARWSEIDGAAKLWVIPGRRMKGGREHRVPLSAPALAILDELAERRTGEFIFAGGVAGRPLSNMAMLQLLRRMECDDVTVHGFRSTFRDWAAERTRFQNEVIEMALAHAISDKVEAAYRRGDLFDKRRRLMEAWGGYCAVAPTAADDNVRPLRRA